MVSTRSVGSRVPPDPNRVIAVVTGANSGYGLGICQQLLKNLSLPPGTPMPASRLQPTALAPSQKHLLKEIDDSAKDVSLEDPPTLTLILACRSLENAEYTKSAILKRHDKELARRRKQGTRVRKGWREGLKVDCEIVDLDSVGGKDGVLAFCERLRESYPHLTSLFLNAGLGPYIGFSTFLFFKQLFSDGFFETLSKPKHNIEEKGRMSADGERGAIWGVNVLAPYILAKQLLPLLQRSPSTLPFNPRIIYTGSNFAGLERLKPEPLDDYQLLSYAAPREMNCYGASKTMGDLVMSQIDKQLYDLADQGSAPVRCLISDAGNVTTNIYNTGLGSSRFVVNILWSIYWLTFFACRILGSPKHPVYPTEAVLSILYAALVDERYLMSPEKVPAQKFHTISTRWGKTYVGYGEVDRWEEAEDIGRGQVKACEAVRLEWRRREGLE